MNRANVLSLNVSSAHYNSNSSLLSTPSISMQVYFNITIGLHSCPDDEDEEDDVVQVFVRPVGYNESSIIKVHSRCRCHCGPDWHCHDDTTHQSTCGEVTPDTDRNNQDLNNRDMHTHTPDLDPEHTPTRPHTHGPEWSRQCRAEGSGVDCNGRGVCVCGKCVCERNSLGTVYGQYCQMDDYSCPYQHGLLCGGNTHTHTIQDCRFRILRAKSYSLTHTV